MSAMPGQTPQVEEGLTEITMVQKVALQTKLKAKNLTFDKAAEEFYAKKGTPAPATMDDMLYEDALALVATLNSK